MGLPLGEAANLGREPVERAMLTSRNVHGPRHVEPHQRCRSPAVRSAGCARHPAPQRPLEADPGARPSELRCPEAARPSRAPGATAASLLAPARPTGWRRHEPWLKITHAPSTHQPPAPLPRKRSRHRLSDASAAESADWQRAELVQGQPAGQVGLAQRSQPGAVCATEPFPTSV